MDKAGALGNSTYCDVSYMEMKKTWVLVSKRESVEKLVTLMLHRL